MCISLGLSNFIKNKAAIRGQCEKRARNGFANMFLAKLKGTSWPSQAKPSLVSKGNAVLRGKQSGCEMQSAVWVAQLPLFCICRLSFEPNLPKRCTSQVNSNVFICIHQLSGFGKKKKTKKTQAASKSVQIEFENGRSPTYFAYVGFSDRNWLLFLFRLQLLMAVSLEFSQNGKMVMVKKKKKW